MTSPSELTAVGAQASATTDEAIGLAGHDRLMSQEVV